MRISGDNMCLISKYTAQTVISDLVFISRYCLNNFVLADHNSRALEQRAQAWV